MKTIVPLCVAMNAAFAFSLSHAADRAALVIGVDQYANLPASAQLRVAVQDANLLGDTLSKLPEPFDVTLLLNAGREDLSRGLDQFIDKAKGASCAIIYFAGHGIEFHGENYLIVSDTKVSAKPDEDVRRVKERLYYEALSMKKVMDDLSQTEANLQLVILDACRDNPLEVESQSGTRSIMGSQSGLGRVNAPSGMLISYSADAGQQANDGLFTSILSTQLKRPGSTIMQVFANTRAEVRRQATVLQAEGKGVLHEPAEYSKLDPSALTFSFVKGDSESAPAGAPGAAMVPAGVSAFQDQKVVETKIALAELNSKIKANSEQFRKADQIIMTLTHNRRRPVKEGTAPYFQCVAAQKIMDEISQKAPGMKAEKTKLEAIMKALGAPLDEDKEE